jgi:hypothetical protein
MSPMQHIVHLITGAVYVEENIYKLKNGRAARNIPSFL